MLDLRDGLNFVVGPDWQIQSVGDFNADGRSDIVWRSNWGAVSIWWMNSSWYIGETCCLPMDTGWQLRGLLPMGIQRLDLQEGVPRAWAE